MADVTLETIKAQCQTIADKISQLDLGGGYDEGFDAGYNYESILVTSFLIKKPEDADYTDGFSAYKGDTVSTFDYKWETNKTPTKLTIQVNENTAIDITPANGVTSGTGSLTGLTITTTALIKITASFSITLESGKVVTDIPRSKSLNITFEAKPVSTNIYYGVEVHSDTFKDGSALKGKLTAQGQTTAAHAVAFYADTGTTEYKYVYYCAPTSWGVPKFVYGEKKDEYCDKIFATTFDDTGLTFSEKDSSDKSHAYSIYRSPYPNYGAYWWKPFSE